MDLDQLKQILDLVREHDLSEFEVEHEGLKLKIRKHPAGVASTVPTGPATSPPGGASQTSSAPAAPASPPASPAGPASTIEAGEEIELAVVKSPIVGTFYR